jgi:hypothetical protein
MPVSRVSPSTPATKPGANRTSPPNRTALTLPTQLSEPSTSLQDLIIALFGEKKIGKTSLLGEFEDCFVMQFEPGGKGLRLKAREVNSWRDFVGYVDLLIKNPGQFKNVAIDTMDLCYTTCSRATCEKLGIDNPGDESHGKGWAAIDKEFTFQMSRLMKCGRGVILVSHAEPKEFTSRTGGTYHKLCPTMSTQARRYVTGVADIIAYYGYYGKERYLTISGSDELDAGHRMGERFRTPEGLPIHSIPMGNSAKEAYANFERAFNNKQADVCDPDEVAQLSEIPVKRESRRR